jgi:hypothetical protein
MLKAYPISSIGIVAILNPRFSVLLYHTTGSSIKLPVKIPLTIKNGIRMIIKVM